MEMILGGETALPSLCGAYCLTHEPSGRLLVGVAVDLRRRYQMHRQFLEAGLHACQELQEAYDEAPAISFDYFVCASIEQAQRKESELLAQHQASGRLFAEAQRYFREQRAAPKLHD